MTNGSYTATVDTDYRVLLREVDISRWYRCQGRQSQRWRQWLCFICW